MTSPTVTGVGTGPGSAGAPAPATLPPVLNPFEPGFFDDPYSRYAALREADPVHRSPIGIWMLFGYDDVVRILRDPDLSVEDTNAALPEAMRNPAREAAVAQRGRRGSRTILNLDPPDHHRIRRLMAKVFTPGSVASLRPRVRQLVDETLDAIEERAAAGGGDDDDVDVIADLAFPLPFTVISELLGMPLEHRDDARTWSRALVRTLEPFMTDEQLTAALDASDKMQALVVDAIDHKRRHPDDRLLSSLVAAHDGGHLSGEELREQVVLLYIAGHETTVNLIGNGTLALLRHRDQLERLVADPSLDDNAVDELLRFDSPVQFSRRIATSDYEVAGHRIERGAFMMTCLGSANRDPARWGADADSLDLARDGAAQHASFGGGLHSCLGAHLARLEGREAIPALVRRFPRMELADDRLAWNGRIVLRGLDALPVSLGRG